MLYLVINSGWGVVAAGIIITALILVWLMIEMITGTFTQHQQIIVTIVHEYYSCIILLKINRRL